MIGPDTQRLLFTLLLQTASFELKIESFRHKLCSISSFHPHQAFQRIDSLHKGRICSFDLVNFLKDRGCFNFSEAECEKLITYFDADCDGLWQYKDLENLFLTASDNLLRRQVTDRMAFKL